MSNAERLAAITSGEVYFAGPNVIAANVPNPIPNPDPVNPPVNLNGEVKLHAPNPIDLGNYVGHFDTDHQPNGRDQLMGPAEPHPILNIAYAKDVLLDLGWTILPEPEIELDTATVGFTGTGIDDGASVPETVTITNNGLSDLRILSISLIGASPNEFQITGGGQPGLLQPEDSRQVTLVFDPSTVGTKLATLRIYSNDTYEWVERVTLSGLAFDGTAATAWVDFGFEGEEMGTEAAPFDSTGEGIGFVMAGGTINFRPGTSSETMSIDKAMTLVNAGPGSRGAPSTTVRIGDLSMSRSASWLFGRSTNGFVATEQ